MAIPNYFSVEMRHSVTTLTHKLKRMVDNLLFSLTCRTPVTLMSLGAFPPGVSFPPGRPRGWLPLYTMVTFRPDISYASAKRKAAEQTRVMSNAGIVGSVALGVAASLWAWHGWRCYFTEGDVIRRSMSVVSYSNN
jgi:kynurenine 3-monooxygenase